MSLPKNIHRLSGRRMPSTLTGTSGHVYILSKLLKPHPRNPEMNIYLAHGQLRTHVDVNENDRTLIYEYFSHNLLAFVQRNQKNLSLKVRKSILWELGLAVGKMHAKEWIHLDIKPDNIVMVDCHKTDQGHIKVEKAALSDFDCSLHLEGEKLLNAGIGNVMWRSPEAHIGKGIGKPSDVFSYGLLCLYVITGVETLRLDFDELQEAGIEPEMEIMSRLITLFGPVDPELVAHINEEQWGPILTELSEATTRGDPNMRFDRWTEHVFPNLNAETKRVISTM
ncbi:Hypothetical protein PENO1_088530 [Penicillium occitanis (nom. inval.)]|nr:Hypothetical protein PENO1_088530 [Penicillium occitanis (nom. inval.)]PCG94787.1 hypothetical protein PENOC_081070 [Penicillium occitanis (nom. inval.)]